MKCIYSIYVYKYTYTCLSSRDGEREGGQRGREREENNYGGVIPNIHVLALGSGLGRP